MHVGIDEVIAWATRGTNRERLVKCAEAFLENDRNAEDLVQIAMEKVIKAHLRNPERIKRKPTPIQTEKVLYAYLARTIQNTRIDQVRKKQVIEHLKVDVPETPWEDPGITFMELRETVGRVMEQDLTEQQRKVIHHRYWDDLTEAETAKRMHIATGTVKATIFQARAILRDSDELREAWNAWCRPSQRAANSGQGADISQHGAAAGAAESADQACISPAAPSDAPCDHVTEGSAPRGHSPSQKATVDGEWIPMVEPSWGMSSVGAR